MTTTIPYTLQLSARLLAHLDELSAELGTDHAGVLIRAINLFVVAHRLYGQGMAVGAGERILPEETAVTFDEFFKSENTERVDG